MMNGSGRTRDRTSTKLWNGVTNGSELTFGAAVLKMGGPRAVNWESATTFEMRACVL